MQQGVVAGGLQRHEGVKEAAGCRLQVLVVVGEVLVDGLGPGSRHPLQLPMRAVRWRVVMLCGEIEGWATYAGGNIILG